MQPIRDETEPPVIRLSPAPMRQGDLLAVTTFWLALAGNLTILFSWTQRSRTTHGPAMVLAHGLLNVGAVFVVAAFLLMLLLVVRTRRSTKLSRAAVVLTLVGMMLALLSPAI